MELKLIKGLEHQQKAVDSIVKALENAVSTDDGRQAYENPKANVSETIDIKMETGTGKTYVYTHTMYELHKLFGINKFVVIVPTLAIKAGARQFMSEQYVLNHFRNIYDAEIQLCEVAAQKAAKNKGRRNYPSAVSEFFNGSSQQENKIFVLLLNPLLLMGNSKLLTEAYDMEPFGVDGAGVPLNAIRKTRPFLIIDEPHRFSRGQKAYEMIEKQMCPQCILRFGATFPMITEGKGKNKVTKRDYGNLVYNLDACQSFNQGLIKGIAKEHLEMAGGKEEKLRITEISKGTTVGLTHIMSSQKKTYTLGKGDSLAIVSDAMEGISVQEIGRDFVVLSNGIEKRKGDEFEVNAYAASYQEQMLQLAIQRHFETERKNFERSPRIKTLALFFIDDIVSYRGDGEDEKSAWLRDAFERLLRERIEKELADESTSEEYKSYLLASKENISLCHGGYFAQDNSDSDEEIAREVDEILHKKAELLSIKDKDGKWNTRRFLFSKWTLKEGWDNPNVFTITKLRSSGSENSKLQEVGRGLRLPVDELGNRISNEEFYLNYIVDFTEKDFANRLVAEINAERVDNGEGKETLVVSDEKLKEVAEKRGVDTFSLLSDLHQKNYVNGITKEVNIDNIDDFYSEYPEFRPEGGLNNGRVTDRNKNSQTKAKIRKEKFEELKEMWMQLNQKYVVFFDSEIDDRISEALPDMLGDDVFCQLSITSQRAGVRVDASGAMLVQESGAAYFYNGKPMAYNEFLKQANKATAVPITMLHSAICEYAKGHEITNENFNSTTLTHLVSKITAWKIKNMVGVIQYKKANYNSKSTKLTDAKGNVLDEVALADIGVIQESGKVPEHYLYNVLAYDSELEKKNILTDIDNVEVFGKIPRRSIAIPTIDGTYSPDFMYVVRRDGKPQLNVVIESKGVDNDAELRGNEGCRIACAEKFFEQLQKDGIEVRFHKQINNEEMKAVLEGMMELGK